MLEEVPLKICLEIFLEKDILKEKEKHQNREELARVLYYQKMVT